MYPGPEQEPYDYEINRNDQPTPQGWPPNKLSGYEPYPLQGWAAANPNGVLVYNPPGGIINMPSNYQGAGHGHLIYNDGGVVNLINAPVYHCKFCRSQFESEALLENHNWAAFKRCSSCNNCFENWDQHNLSHRHTICGVSFCSHRGVDFHSKHAYLEHFASHHNKHCRDERKSIGRGFCSRCYWQHGYSHDKDRTACRASVALSYQG